MVPLLKVMNPPYSEVSTIIHEQCNLNNVCLIFGSCWGMVVESVTCKELLTLSFCELLANSELIDPVLTPSQHSDKKLVEALGGGER